MTPRVPFGIRHIDPSFITVGVTMVTMVTINDFLCRKKKEM
jgi:hypothetical protein